MKLIKIGWSAYISVPEGQMLDLITLLLNAQGARIRDRKITKLQPLSFEITDLPIELEMTDDSTA